MAEPDYPLLLPIDVPPAAELPDGADLCLRELRPAGCAEIAAWPGQKAAVAAVLRDLCGVDLPERPGRFATGALCLVAATGPGRWLLLADGADPVGALRDRLPAMAGAVVDLGHSRRGIRLAGPRAAAVLLKGLAIDLDGPDFPAGSVAQSSIHHVGVTLLRRAPQVFDLYVYRSLAVDFAAWLLDACAEYGAAVAPPDPGCLALE